MMSTTSCGTARVGEPNGRIGDLAHRYGPALRHFGSYQGARADFLSCADAAGASVRRYVHPQFAELSVDVAILPGAVRSSALVVVSGTHGIEGHAGSALQRQFLRDATVPRPVDTILVHGLNPYGFAHDRRVDEDNVDVNRNFVDFRRPPGNPDYAAVHQVLVPADWHGPAHRHAQGALLELLREWGPARLQFAVTHGQYTQPDGLFYGGERPSWSNLTLRAILAEHVLGHSKVAYIDLHTGLGEPGLGEPIFRGGRDPDAYQRACRWYGDEVTRSEDGSASSTPIDGNTASAVAATLPDEVELTAITLEFGTLDAQTVLAALQADNWYGLRQRRSEPEYLPTRAAMAAAFAPRNFHWQCQMMTRGAAIIGRAERGLLGPSLANQPARTTAASYPET